MALTTIDMHAHTTASDGQLTPSELVRLAASAGISGVAITDHDTTAGVEEAMQEGKLAGIHILPGIEISTVADGQDIHVLGYYTNNADPQWQQRIGELRETRVNRNHILLQKLNALGLELTLDEVFAAAAHTTVSIGRPHFAEVLIQKGYVSNKQEAFDKYLGEHGAAFVQPLRIHPVEAFQWIRDAGGVCVLAHPGIYNNDSLVERLLDARPDGIEVYHSDHTKEQSIRYLQSANQRGLIATGGSDFHGISEDGESFHGGLGSVVMPLSTMEELYNKHLQRK